MTAYLQPGDKIIVQVPSSSQDHANIVHAEFAKVGIDVAWVMAIDSRNPISVVAVIRSPEGCSHLDPEQG